MNQFLTVENNNGALEVSLRNDWVFDNIPALSEELERIDWNAANEVRFRCGGIEEFDLSGAWLLYDKALDIEDVGGSAEFENFKAAHLKFLQHIIDSAAVSEYIPGFFDKQKTHYWRNSMETIGKNTIEAVESVGYISRRDGSG